MTRDAAKRAAGKKAAEWIEDGMIVGLGSGTTAQCFIHSLIEKCKQGLSVKAVSSSRTSSEMAKKGGLELLDMNVVSHVDITVDGADEIDPEKRMIKGGGGAHVREKILAAASRDLVILIDETKQVKKLGRTKLPIEVIFYGSASTKAHIEKLGKGSWRMNPDHTLFLTDNGNLLFDMSFSSPPNSMEDLHQKLLQIPGVVDTGFFPGLAKRVIIGYPDGSTQVNN